MKPSAAETFAAKVDATGGADACHLWTGSRDKAGYGRFCYDGVRSTATRWLLGHLRGRPLERRELACHRCDNPPCVNPNHLYVGDAGSNVRDMHARGRRFDPAKPVDSTRRGCCKVDGCQRPIQGQGYCVSHFHRWRRHGDPLAGRASPDLGAVCSVAECGERRHAKDMCQWHYANWRYSGRPEGVRPNALNRSPIERFTAFVDASAGPDGCHLWTGGTTKGGYGAFYVGRVQFGAHRWIVGHLRGRALTPQERVRHSCGNSSCVNPLHLNSEDMGEAS